MSNVAKNQDWFKLDNSAKIFPSVSNYKETNTFRVTISLTEKINPENLQKAVDIILERYPMFRVKLKKGLFWNYFDYNSKPFLIREMTYRICGEMNPKENNGYLFKVIYRNKDVAIEMFHSLADGGGVMMLLKSLVYEYLLLEGKNVKPDNLVLTKNEKPEYEEYEDANVKYYNKKNRKHVSEERAYRIKGTQIVDNNTGIISGILKTSEILKLSRENNMTITEYLASVLMYIIYKTQLQYRESIKSNQKPVKIFIPVNLRKHFPSKTLRNFTNFIKTKMYMNKPDITFEEIKKLVKKQFKQGIQKDELIRKMSENVAFEKNIFLRITPYFLKNFVLKIGYNMLGIKLNTMSLTNIGKFAFPESMKPYIVDLTATINAGRFNTVNCAVVSYEEKFKITFSRSIIETTIEKEFFRFLTSKGLEVEIESNFVEEYA
ncbi:MAG: hypothetical protein K9L64_06175 [Candidatus Izimaplasma sp.]|nr:hypothetical protein [Candidatus Izimaplasma bacterium]